jgi:hypothetical protein
MNFLGDERNKYKNILNMSQYALETLSKKGGVVAKRSFITEKYIKKCKLKVCKEIRVKCIKISKCL